MTPDPTPDVPPRLVSLDAYRGFVMLAMASGGLGLAQVAAREGGSRPASLNAANEVAVSAFLEGGLNFEQIPAVMESVMATTSGGDIRDLDDVLAADAEARARASRLIRPRAAQA